MEVLDSGHLEKGLYRNHHGREMKVLGMWSVHSSIKSLGRIYLAETVESWGPSFDEYIVTAESLRDDGYEQVKE